MLSAAIINLCDVQKLIVQAAAKDVATMSDYHNLCFAATNRNFAKTGRHARNERRRMATL